MTIRISNKNNSKNSSTAQGKAQAGNSKHLWKQFWDVDLEQVQHLPPGAYYELILDQFFQASHYVTVDGRTGPLHTHSYRLEVRCRSQVLLPETHVVVGYRPLRERIKKIVQVYNHTVLNDLPPFQQLQPTTEALLGVIAQQIQRLLADLPVKPVSLTLWESPDEGLRYRYPAQNTSSAPQHEITLHFSSEES